MPLRYILDGYNILKQVSVFTNKRLKQGRPDFIALLCTSRRLSKQEVVVVFDGYPDLSERTLFKTNLQAIFSRGSSADDKIRHMLEHAKTPSQIVVVSDDKEVRFFARVSKAQVLGVREFLTWLCGKQSDQRQSDAKSQSEDKNLSYKQVLDINRELRRVWLGE